MGDSFTAKDFRTWAGTRECARLLLAACADATEDSDKKQCIKEAIEQTAALLGNTPTICRKCYVHPAILTAFEDGSLAERIAAPENTVFRILGDV
jgi:DNA topoisomerase I